MEGFYGKPWSHDERLETLDFLGAHALNAYVYAPKDDALHRARWREPYGADALDRFAQLDARARDVSVRFGFAISPGLDIDYGAGTDREALLAKLLPLVDAGVRWFLLLLDDIPLQPGLAARQAELATWLHDALVVSAADATLTLCPTEYVGTRPSQYLHDLGAGLPTVVDVMWTGPTVCSPTITATDAAAWAAALGGRPPLLWDNYPVNDGPMAASLHLGPYVGRDPALAGVVRGVLCNPMTQARASRIALATVAAFVCAPTSYDPESAWELAIEEVGGHDAPAVRALARACADGPLAPPSAAPFARLVDAVAGAVPGAGWTAAVGAAAAELRALRATAPAMNAQGGGLAGEVAPWAAAGAAEATAGLAALRLLQQLQPVAVPAGDGQVRAAAPDPHLALQAVFAMLFSWSAARTNTQVVLGPRFALYPAVVQRADGTPALDAGLALREDANLVDRLCRFALDRYEHWRTTAVDSMTVIVDGEERPCGSNQRFAPGGAVLRCGAARTNAEDPLPFREPRADAEVAA